MAGISAKNAEMRAYEFTIEAIVCLERAFKDLAGAGFRQGPKMRTADGVVVTPDMAFESGGGQGGTGYRAVGEIKSSFPQYESAVDQMVRQVRHYDSGLGGWEGEASSCGGGQLGDHDIVIGVRSDHAHDFAVRLPVALRAREVEIKSPLSIIGIIRNKNNNGNDRFLIKRSFGKISHKKTHDAFGKGWSINASEMTNGLNNTKFYDSRPPLPYVMSVLWVNVFLNLAHGKKLKKLRMNAQVTMDVEVGRIHRLASRLAPQSNPGCVKRAWIKDSMEEFVRIGLAERTGIDKYRIFYTIHKSRPLEWLAGMATSGADPPNGSENSI